MIGTLAIASAICVRLWFIMEDIRLALTDPMTMAVIVTDDGIRADNKKAEGMLEGARHGFQDTENALAVFSVCIIMIALAMAMRIYRDRDSTGSSRLRVDGPGNDGHRPSSQSEAYPQEPLPPGRAERQRVRPR